MRTYWVYIVSLAFAFLVSACGNKSYFAFDDVRYVDKFPINCVVDNADTLCIDAIGILGIKNNGDCLILSCVSREGCLSAYSKEDGSLISRPFIKIGNGPGELLYCPFMCWFDFYEVSGALKAGIFDYNGKYIEYDIGKSTEEGTASWKCLADSLSALSGARYFGAGDGRLICRKGSLEEIVYERFLVDFSGKTSCTQSMEKLNSVTSSNTNLLATHFVYNQERDIMAELGGMLSVVHLYSLSNDYHKTLCIGKKLEDINDVEQYDVGDLPMAYYDVTSFDDFFAGLYLNTTNRQFGNNCFFPEIHLFSWEGAPLAKFSLPAGTMYFDIDVSEGCLYVVENGTEQILKYDISHPLSDVIHLTDL